MTEITGYRGIINAVAGVCLLFGFASQAAALGLGNLDIQSNLDQPLNGVIELNVAPSDDPSSIEAVIATRDEFTSLGMDYPDYLQYISVRVEGTGDDVVLRLSSNKVIIKEPFLQILIKVDWSGGSFLREYTALIDPPVYAAKTPNPISAPRSVGSDQSYQVNNDVITAEPLDDSAIVDESFSDPEVVQDNTFTSNTVIDGRIVREDTLGQTSEDSFYQPEANSDPITTNTGVVSTTDDAKYGPVTSGESLSLIAQELQQQFPGLSIYQIMKVLFEENPESFIDSNINGLIRGSTLRIGDLQAIRAVDLAEAKEFFGEQIIAWNQAKSVSDSDPISVAQDTYDSGEDFLSSNSADESLSSGDDSLSGTTGDEDSFRVGSSDDTTSFVSSADGSTPDGEVIALREEILELESELTSSELENRELTERISILEGQLADLNRLVSLNVEDAELASLEATLAEQNNAEDGLSLEGSLADTVEGSLVDAVDDSLVDAVDDSLVDTVEGSLVDAVDDSLVDTVDDSLVGAVDDSLLGDDSLVDSVDDSLVDTVDDSLLDTVDDSLLVDDSLVDNVEDSLLAEDSPLTDDSLTVEDALGTTAEDSLDAVEDTVADTSTPTPAPIFVNDTKVSFLDSVLDGGLWKVFAGVGGLLLGGLALLFIRRRRVDEEFEISMMSIETHSDAKNSEQSLSETNEESKAAGNNEKETSFLTVYSDTDAVVQADEVDPIAEANVYVAYGRDEQAEEVLLDGITSNPDRIDIKHKLLGLYHKNRKAEQFERLAEEVYANPDAVDSETWKDIVEMGKEVAPNNPLFDLSVDDLIVSDQGAEAQESQENADDSLSLDNADDSLSLDKVDDSLSLDGADGSSDDPDSYSSIASMAAVGGSLVAGGALLSDDADASMEDVESPLGSLEPIEDVVSAGDSEQVDYPPVEMADVEGSLTEQVNDVIADNDPDLEISDDGFVDLDKLTDADDSLEVDLDVESIEEPATPRASLSDAVGLIDEDNTKAEADEEGAMAIEFINFDGERSEISELDDVKIDVFDVQHGLDQEATIFDDEASVYDDSDEKENMLPDEEAALEANNEIVAPAGMLDISSDNSIDESTMNFEDLQDVSDMEIDNDYDEAVTQYELAKVFVDLGDEEGARKILNDIIEKRVESDEVYKDSKNLLDSIGA